LDSNTEGFEHLGFDIALYVLWLESLSSMCAKLRTVAASNNRALLTRSLYYCLFAPHIYGVVLRAYSVCGEPHISAQRQRSGCNNIPSFLFNEPHRSHVLHMKAVPGASFTSWSQHHFVAIGFLVIYHAKIFRQHFSHGVTVSNLWCSGSCYSFQLLRPNCYYKSHHTQFWSLIKSLSWSSHKIF